MFSLMRDRYHIKSYASLVLNQRYVPRIVFVTRTSKSKNNLQYIIMRLVVLVYTIVNNVVAYFLKIFIYRSKLSPLKSKLADAKT